MSRFPEKLFRAVTTFNDREDVRKELKKRLDWPDTEFVLDIGIITSVHGFPTLIRGQRCATWARLKPLRSKNGEI